MVTGATSGIGEATALKFAGKGFDLIITGRREDRLNALKGKLEESGSRVLTLCFDVRNEEQVKDT